MRLEDLFDEGRAVYDYGNGHRVVRTRSPEGKRIRQENSPPVTELWHHPESAPIASSATVVLVEGEKTADAMIRLGASCVSTWPGGSSAVNKFNIEPLRAKNVVIVPDNASGYGSEFFGEPYRNDAFWRNTGGDHVHVTAFRGRGYTFGPGGTVNPEHLVGPALAGVDVKPFPTEEDDMYGDEDRARDAEAKKRVDAVYAALFGPRNLEGEPAELSWKVGPNLAQKARYGVLPIVIHNQTLIAQQSGRIAAIEAVVEQLAEREGVELDYSRIEAAAERGAARALEGFNEAPGEPVETV